MGEGWIAATLWGVPLFGQLFSVLLLLNLAFFGVWDVRAWAVAVIVLAIVVASFMGYFVVLRGSGYVKYLFRSYSGTYWFLLVVGVLLAVVASFARSIPMAWVPLLVFSAYLMGYGLSGHLVKLATGRA